MKSIYELIYNNELTHDALIVATSPDESPLAFINTIINTIKNDRKINFGTVIIDMAVIKGVNSPDRWVRCHYLSPACTCMPGTPDAVTINLSKEFFAKNPAILNGEKLSD